jgi:hypothetical protein
MRLVMVAMWHGGVGGFVAWWRCGMVALWRDELGLIPLSNTQ